MQKILIIQTAFIGDVVLATGILEKLHAFYPAARIDFLLRKGNESLLNEHPFLHEILIWQKKENKYGNLFDLLKKIRITRYDLVVNVQRFAATGLLAAFSGAKMTVGFDKNPFSFLLTKKIKHNLNKSSAPVHEIERNNSLVAFLTDNAAAKPRLYPSKIDYVNVEKYKQKPYICIAPASVWFTKQYPKEKWVSFINKLPRSVNIYLLGAPSDSGLCSVIERLANHPGLADLSGKLSFLQSAALQQSAVMNYVNDSAPMHFASSVNAPVTAVYCSTVPAFGYGPLSDKSFIVETTEPLSCRPCGLHGYKACPLQHFKCALTITDEQLLKSVQNLND